MVEAGTESHAGQQKITSNIRHVCDPKPGVPPSARRPSRACRPVRRLASRSQNRVPAKRTQKLIADESPSSRARDVAARHRQRRAIRCLKQQTSGATLLRRTVLFNSWARWARSFLSVRILRSSQACSAQSSHRELKKANQRRRHHETRTAWGAGRSESAASECQQRAAMICAGHKPGRRLHLKASGVLA